MPSRAVRLHLLAAAAYALLAFILLHTLIFHNGTHAAGFDYFNYNWNFWWIRHALGEGLNVYINNMVMAPHTVSFGYHALAAFWYPLWALTEPLVGTLTAMTLILFTMAFLNGYVLFVFLRSEGVHPGLALLGGALLQASPVTRYFYYNNHINLGDWFWLPASALLWGQIARAVGQGRPVRALLWAGVMGLALWGVGHTDLQFPIFVAFWLVPYGLWTVWRVVSPHPPLRSLSHRERGEIRETLRNENADSVRSTHTDRLRRLMLLALCGAVTLGIALALLWFAGPLPYMRQFSGTLAPGPVEDRPGIPFPRGYLMVDAVWWWWNVPTLGGSATVLLLISLVLWWRLGKKTDSPPRRQERQEKDEELNHRDTEDTERKQGSSTFNLALSTLHSRGSTLVPRYSSLVTPIWLWLLILLPPLLLSMGPNISLFGVSLPMPFRLLYDITDGMFKMPWRLAPIFVAAAAVVIGKVVTRALQQRPDRIHHRDTERTENKTAASLTNNYELKTKNYQLTTKHLALRVFFPALALLGIAVDGRWYETAPLNEYVKPVLPEYTIHQRIGEERGAPYDGYVVLDVPTAAGTGEVLVGNERAIQYQFYGMTHHKRTLNGFISRAPVEFFWPIRTDDPLLAWLGQRRDLDTSLVEPRLRQIIDEWPVGYALVHQDDLGRNGATPQEIIGYFNQLDDLLCPLWVEGALVAYRTAWHPDGCPGRTPDEIEPGVFRIDIGSSGDERFIGWGWHWPELVGGTTTWRWTGQYPQTDVYLDLPPAAYTVTLTMQAFHEPRRLTLRLNDAVLVPVDLRVVNNSTDCAITDCSVTIQTEGLQTISFTLPAETVREGKHLKLTLDYDAVIVPAEIGQSADRRPLAVAVDSITFQRGES